MIGILLAAGRGTRMKSEKPKVLFDLNGQPLCFPAFEALFLHCKKVVVVVGYRGESVKQAILDRALALYPREQVETKLLFYTQDPPRGTGEAVAVAVEGLGKNLNPEDDVIILNGDLPLIRPITIEKTLKVVKELKLSAACLAFMTINPKGLGRILRDHTGTFMGIREEKDCNADEKKIREVNGGAYYFKAELLLEKIKGLTTTNAQGEFYLTDLLGNKYSDRNVRSEALMMRNARELSGANTTFELAIARKIHQTRLQKKVCEQFGVELEDPGTTYLSVDTQFEGGCVVGPGNVFKGKNTIAAGVHIEGQCLIENSQILQDAKIKWGSVIESSRVGARSQVGPMAHLRPDSELAEDVKIGNFVELKKTKMAKGSKASHLSYLGDATVGEEANVGCGTITCNYDGFQKHQTHIGKGAFIGSDTQLVAPVSIGDNAYVASGTTVTTDVPAGALALSRPQLILKEGYAEKLAERREQIKNAQRGK